MGANRESTRRRRGEAKDSKPSGKPDVGRFMSLSKTALLLGCILAIALYSLVGQSASALETAAPTADGYARRMPTACGGGGRGGRG
jgi:hypothetical protein